MPVKSLVEILGVDEVFEYDHLLIVTLEAANYRHQLETGDFVSLWEPRDMEMSEQKDVFPRLDNDFHMKYKFIGIMNLWEGRSAIFMPRFPDGFGIASNPTINLSDIKQRRFKIIEDQSIKDIQAIEDEKIFETLDKIIEHKNFLADMGITDG
jgi:hypothetical protein